MYTYTALMCEGEIGRGREGEGEREGEREGETERLMEVSYFVYFH